MFICLWSLSLTKLQTPWEQGPCLSLFLLPSWCLQWFLVHNRDSIRHAEWTNDSCGNKTDMTWKTTDAEQVGGRSMVSTLVSGRMFNVQPDLFPIYQLIFLCICISLRDDAFFIMTPCCYCHRPFVLFYGFLLKSWQWSLFFILHHEWFQRRRPFPSTINKLSGPLEKYTMSWKCLSTISKKRILGLAGCKFLHEKKLSSFDKHCFQDLKIFFNEVVYFLSYCYTKSRDKARISNLI